MIAAALLQQPPAAVARANAPPVVADRIILVGDSTMAPGSGWGSTFCERHVKAELACLNLARGGRSTRSYRQEGSWALVQAELAVKGYRATYVLIQFGHNDQSQVPERWTDLATEFPANLRRYVAEVRAAGGVPVLLTPLARRAFVGGRVNNTLHPWADAVVRIAAEMQTPLIELNAHSATAIQAMGAAAATDLAMARPLPAELAAARNGTTLPQRSIEEARLPDVPTSPTGPQGQVLRKFDYTHVGETGARLFAGLVAHDLAAAVPALRRELVP